jgi:hypothetical protein
VIWWGGRQGLWRFAGGQLSRVPPPGGLVVQRINGAAIIRDVQAITKDRSGALWVSITREGVFQLADGVWTPFGNVRDLPRQPAVTELTDSAGRVWFGYTDNRVAVLDRKQLRIYSSHDGLEVGSVTALNDDGRSVWVGGEFGLARFDGDRFTMIASERPEQFSAVSGIVETAAGDLWLNQSSCIAQIKSSELRNARENSLYRVKPEIFGSLDGLPGAPAPIRPLPTALASSDGVLWFADGNGVLWIDPAHIPRNPMPPPVAIQSLTVDGTRYAPTPGLQLPVHAANIQIDYTALSLSIPERVHFRYWLEGADREWHDAGPRRQAFYPNSGPLSLSRDRVQQRCGLERTGRDAKLPSLTGMVSNDLVPSVLARNGVSRDLGDVPVEGAANRGADGSSVR